MQPVALIPNITHPLQKPLPKGLTWLSVRFPVTNQPTSMATWKGTIRTTTIQRNDSVWAYFEQFDEALHKSLNIFGLEKIWVGQEVIFHKSKGHAVLT